LRLVIADCRLRARRVLRSEGRFADAPLHLFVSGQVVQLAVNPDSKLGLLFFLTDGGDLIVQSEGAPATCTLQEDTRWHGLYSTTNAH
jgi:hypothetical protein